jgi:UDP-N-acetylglucosamine 2-epimerase (non-hydrolysing)
VKKLSLCTIVGTRPEIIRLSETIKKCDCYFEHTLVHTGQNYDYELNQIFFENLGLRAPDHYFEVTADSANLGDAIGAIIAKSYELLSALMPDAVLVLGDTNSCLATLAAKRLHIPIFHMEAGNRCFDELLPEEMNRRIVDHIADINLCYSEHARRNLMAEGRPRERTFVTGSPMAEVLRANLTQIEASDILTDLKLEKSRYFLLSAHREENIDNSESFIDLMQSVNQLAREYDMPILYSCHPRAAKQIEAQGFQFDQRVIQHKPFGFHDYNNLQINALCVISDSGTLPEESAFLKFPAVSIRTSSERPEALDKGIFTLGGITAEQVLQAVRLTIAMSKIAIAKKGGGGAVPDYRDENVSIKVVKLIQSYTGIVNTFVWRKC